MNRKLFIFWGLSLLLLAAAIYFPTKKRFSGASGDPAEAGSVIREISSIQSMGNDLKWTRCFQAGDGTLYFEDHRKSTDGGRTLVPQEELDVEEINGAPERSVFARGDSLFALDGPTTRLSPGLYQGKAWRSTDGLQTIQMEKALFHIPQGPPRDGTGGEWYGIYNYRSILEMPDGSWLATMYGNLDTDTLVPWDADAQKELTNMQRTIIVTSSDQGHTWHYLSTVAAPLKGDPVGEGFVEPAITLLQDGRLLCIMRSGHRFPLYASWSEDAGRTWSPPLYTGLDRGCDPCLITLGDGRVALSWGRRFPEGWSIVTPEGDKGRFQFPGSGYTNLSISEDGGLSWSTQRIMERSGTCYSTIIEVEPNVLFMLVDQQYCRIQLRKRNPAESFTLSKDVPFAKVVNHKGEDETLLLDIYKPNKSTKQKHRVIVWVHGGGFKGGDRTQGYIRSLSAAFAERGYVCIAPDYRLREDPRADYPGTISDAVSDIHQALDWVQSQGKELGYDPKEILVGGGSAGGILMSHLCFQQEKRRHNRHIRGFINLWGSPGDKELFAGITNQDPPTLIIHGDQDLTVPYQNSEMLAEGLKKAGVYCELHPFEGAGHTPTDQMDRIIALVESFLARPEVSHP